MVIWIQFRLGFVQGWLFYTDSSFWKPPQMKVCMFFSLFPMFVVEELLNLFVYQALLHSVPFGKMIVLDLFADVKPVWESSSQFYDTPYVW